MTARAGVIFGRIASELHTAAQVLDEVLAAGGGSVALVVAAQRIVQVAGCLADDAAAAMGETRVTDHNEWSHPDYVVEALAQLERGAA
jgi:hypothetical protein